MRDHVTTKERDETAEAAVEEACRLLRPLAGPPLSWAVVSLNNPGSNDPRDLYEAAVEFVIALLNPDFIQERRGADEFLDTYSLIPASIVRKVILPALRLGLPPKKSKSQSGSRSLLLRDRWIATVVTTISKQHKLKPYRNEASLSERRCCGCSVVAEALGQLGVPMSEGSVKRIYMKHKQA